MPPSSSLSSSCFKICLVSQCHFILYGFVCSENLLPNFHPPMYSFPNTAIFFADRSCLLRTHLFCLWGAWWLVWLLGKWTSLEQQVDYASARISYTGRLQCLASEISSKEGLMNHTTQILLHFCWMSCPYFNIIFSFLCLLFVPLLWTLCFLNLYYTYSYR